APRATAQDGDISVHAGLALSAAPEGQPLHRYSRPLHGLGIVMSVGVAGKVSSTTDLEGEVVLGTGISKRQQFSYNWTEDYIGQSRDQLFNMLVRSYVGQSRSFALVAGGGLARMTYRTHSGVRTDPFLPGRPTSPLPDQQLTDWNLTLTGGVEGSLRITDRVSFAPTARVRWLRRPMEGGLPRTLGVSRYLYQ